MKQSFPLTQHFIFWCIHLTPTFLGCSLYLEVRKGGTIHTPKRCLRCRQWGEPSDPAQGSLDLLPLPFWLPPPPRAVPLWTWEVGKWSAPGSQPLYSAMQAHRPHSYSPPGQRPSKSQLSVQADPTDLEERQDLGQTPHDQR